MELMFSKLASLETDSVAIKKASNGAGSAARGTAGSGWGDGGLGSEDEEGLNLKPVSVQRFEAVLSGGHWGLHAYVPVTFSGVHFVRVDCMVGGGVRVLLVLCWLLFEGSCCVLMCVVEVVFPGSTGDLQCWILFMIRCRVWFGCCWVVLKQAMLRRLVLLLVLVAKYE